MNRDVKLLLETYQEVMTRPNVNADHSSRQVGNIPAGAVAAADWGQENNEDSIKVEIVQSLGKMLEYAKAGGKHNYIRIYFDLKQLEKLLDQAIK